MPRTKDYVVKAVPVSTDRGSDLTASEALERAFFFWGSFFFNMRPMELLIYFLSAEKNKGSTGIAPASCSLTNILAGQEGFEPPALGFGVRRSTVRATGLYTTCMVSSKE